MAVSDLGQTLEISHVGIRVAKSFGEKRFRVLPDRRLYLVKIRGIDKSRGHAVSRESVPQKIISAAIDVLGGNDMVSLLRQIL